MPCGGVCGSYWRWLWVREELGGLGVGHLDVMWRGHWAAGCVGRRGSACGVGAGHSRRHMGSGRPEAWVQGPAVRGGWGAFLLSRKLLLRPPGICRSRGGPDLVAGGGAWVHPWGACGTPLVIRLHPQGAINCLFPGVTAHSSQPGTGDLPGWEVSPAGQTRTPIATSSEPALERGQRSP